MFFLFKQKTAYEMRISDWSSDVCSSDLSNKSRRGRNPDLRRIDEKKRPGCPGRSRSKNRKSGSELVTQGQHGRPARHHARGIRGIGVVFAQLLPRRAAVAAQVVGVGAIGIDRRQPGQVAGVVRERLASRL